MYSPALLDRSESWHAFAQSSVKEGEKPLPASTENGVAEVITNLINRKLKPVLRS